jgi:hypothetical protein
MAEAIPDYSEYQEEPGDGDLEKLSNLAHQQRDLEKEIEAAEAKIKDLKAQHRELSWNQIPTLMDELRIKEFSTVEGFKIKVTEDLRVSIPKKNQTEAYDWIDDHDGSALIKRGFVIAFTKEQEPWARKFQRDCAQRKKALPMVETKTVAPATAKKFLKDKLEEGVDVPLPLFGAYRQRIARIDLPK